MIRYAQHLLSSIFMEEILLKRDSSGEVEPELDPKTV
jgi:hypothetical protein